MGNKTQNHKTQNHKTINSRTENPKTISTQTENPKTQNHKTIISQTENPKTIHSQTKKIDVINLSASYTKAKPILEDLSFSLDEGKILSIIGPNGGGKSTLLYLLGKLSVENLIKTNGEIFIDREKIESLSQTKKAKTISYLGQGESLSWHFSVFETILMGRYAHSSPYLPYTKEDKEIALSVLEELDLLHLKERSTAQLSGGEFQKVLLARSLCQNTDIMLLDEPFTYLDIQHQNALVQLIKKIAKEKNKTIVLSLHDLNLCPLLSDKVLALNKKDSFFGNIEEVFKPEILNRIYHTEFGIFEHPKFKIPQVYVE